MLDFLLEFYPLNETPQPVTTETFGCLIHNMSRAPPLIQFTPTVGDQIIVSGGAEPSATIDFPVSATTGLNLTQHSVALCLFKNEALFQRRNSFLLANNRTQLLVGSFVVSARVPGGVAVKDLQEPVEISFVRTPVRPTSNSSVLVGNELLHYAVSGC